MKNLYIIISLILLFTSCSDGVSKDEYAILNEAVDEILKPHGMAFLSQEEMNEIAANNGIDLTGTMSEKDAKIIYDAVAERRKFEFAILDTLRQSDIKAYQSILDLDSITPSQENLVQAPLDLNKITLPEHYEKVEKPSGQGEFLGKIILSRAI